MCALSTNHNWLTETNFTPKLWSGSYKCLFKDCNAMYKAKAVMKDAETILITVYRLGTPNHTQKVKYASWRTQTNSSQKLGEF